jgi:hypothetical protein
MAKNIGEIPQWRRGRPRHSRAACCSKGEDYLQEPPRSVRWRTKGDHDLVPTYVGRRTDTRHGQVLKCCAWGYRRVGASFAVRQASPHTIDELERGTDMKSALIITIVAALLGGCAFGPARYGDHRDGYYQERSYTRDDAYRDRDYYYRGDRNYRDYNYRNGYNSPSDPFRQYGR